MAEIQEPAPSGPNQGLSTSRVELAKFLRVQAYAFPVYL